MDTSWGVSMVWIRKEHEEIILDARNIIYLDLSVVMGLYKVCKKIKQYT